MNLESFKELVQVFDEVKSNELRKKYKDTFINQKEEDYERHIGFKESEGIQYYDGYLWDFLIIFHAVLEDEIYQNLKNLDQKVYVMWDLHSKERSYPNFRRDVEINVNSIDLLHGLEFLPEDIYIFDDSFQWTMILTHEDTREETRACFKLP
jgi:hypothetical protein